MKVRGNYFRLWEMIKKVTITHFIYRYDKFITYVEILTN